MTFKEFEQYEQRFFEILLDLGNTKGREYAHSTDRFANFNRLSEELGIPNYMVGWIFAKKHLDSIASFIKDGKTFSTETIQSRFLDAVLYLILISGMIEEASSKCPATSVSPKQTNPQS